MLGHPDTLPLPVLVELLNRALGTPCAVVALAPDGSVLQCAGGIPSVPSLHVGARFAQEALSALRAGLPGATVLDGVPLRLAGDGFGPLCCSQGGSIASGAMPQTLDSGDFETGSSTTWGVVTALSEGAEVPLAHFGQWLAHTFRNSLASVKLAVQALAHSPRLNERERRRVHIAGREIGRLERLITSGSEFLRPATRARQPLRCADLLVEAIERVRLEVEARRVVLEPEISPALPLPLLQGDPLRVRLAFEALLLAGAQAMPEGGELEVRLEPFAQGVALAVRDRGTALSGGDERAIFLPLGSVARGNGLDLAFAAQVAREQGGSLGAENLQGGGVRLILRLLR